MVVAIGNGFLFLCDSKDNSYSCKRDDIQWDPLYLHVLVVAVLSSSSSHISLTLTLDEA